MRKIFQSVFVCLPLLVSSFPVHAADNWYDQVNVTDCNLADGFTPPPDWIGGSHVDLIVERVPPILDSANDAWGNAFEQVSVFADEMFTAGNPAAAVMEDWKLNVLFSQINIGGNLNLAVRAYVEEIALETGTDKKRAYAQKICDIAIFARDTVNGVIVNTIDKMAEIYNGTSTTPPSASQKSVAEAMEKNSEQVLATAEAVGKPRRDAADIVAAKAAADAAALRTSTLGKGTALSLPLPLSDITLEGVIGRVLNRLLGVVGAVALLLFVWGGAQWMMAVGDSAKIDKAKKTITWAAIGLIAIFSAYAVLQLVIETFSK